MPMRAVLAAASLAIPIVASAAIAAITTGCVDDRGVHLPQFQPNDAVLLIVQGLHEPFVYAFQAQDDGTAADLAFTLSKDDTLVILEYGCTLASLNIPPQRQRPGMRALPEPPLAAHRYNAATDSFDAIEYVPSDFTAATIAGPVMNGCIALAPTHEVLLPPPHLLDTTIVVELRPGVIFVQLTALSATGELARYSFLATADSTTAINLGELPVGRGILKRENDLVMVAENGGLYQGTVELGFTKFADLNTPYVGEARIDRAGDTLWVATEWPGFYQVRGSTVTPVLLPDHCPDICHGVGVVAVSEEEAFAVLGNQLEVIHATHTATISRERLDNMSINTPILMVRDLDGSPLAGSQIGGVFRRVDGRWIAIAASIGHDVEILAPFDEGILIAQNNAVIVEYQYRTEKNCDPISVPGDIFAILPASDALVVVYRDESDRARVVFNPKNGAFNSCPAR